MLAQNKCQANFFIYLAAICLENNFIIIKGDQCALKFQHLCTTKYARQQDLGIEVQPKKMNSYHSFKIASKTVSIHAGTK